MYISFSGDKLYRQCPRAYHHQYVVKTHVAKPENRVHMLYGDTVGKVFETFYSESIWGNDTTRRLLAKVRPTLQRVITNETRRGGVFDWTEPGLKPGTRSVDEVEQEVLLTIPRGLATIRQEFLLGRDAAAEVDLTVGHEGHTLGGRADFMMTRGRHKDLVIIDGKGSRHRHQYTEDRQLRWYAMQYWLKTGKLVDRVGFLYWRFEPGQNLDWLEVTQGQLDDLRSSTLATVTAIERSTSAVKRGAAVSKEFPAVTGDHCKLCRYASVCPDGARVLSEELGARLKEDLASGVEELSM